MQWAFRKIVAAGLIFSKTALSNRIYLDEPPSVNKEKHSDSRERYIVQLYDDPIIAHGSTKPSKNAKLDPNDALVVEYGTYLETRQDEAVATIGGKKLWSYKYAFNGFAIKMTEAEAKAMKNRSDVLSVQRDEVREVETDTSADFLGLTGGGEPWSMGYTGEDVVLGILDTGVNPEHPSFADIETPENGNIGNNIPYGAPPAGFTGTICDFGQQDFNPNDAPAECSNKLLTARCYAIGFSDVVDPSLPCGGDGAELVPWEFFSARDSDGHGSHVASTAAGNYGVEAVLDGQAVGSISGMAPRARVAVYKICWQSFSGSGCPVSGIMAAIDQAIEDGCDVINGSYGSSATTFNNPDDVALLRAADAGIHIAVAAGNSGSTVGAIGTPGKVTV